MSVRCTPIHRPTPRTSRLVLQTRGMSMIEIAIVVVLIAVVMVVSLPMITHASAEARATVCRQNLDEIGAALSGHLDDHAALPAFACDTQDEVSGQSLAQTLKPRLHTPHVLICPSDETKLSQAVGTSYHWFEAHSGVAWSALAAVADQPVLSDREPFHRGADVLVNELVLRADGDSYRFEVCDGSCGVEHDKR